jgi:hypothetical protein
MAKLVRLSMSILLLLVLIAFPLNVPAQLCGGTFAEFAVINGEGNEVPDVTLELVAELSDKNYDEFMRKKAISPYGAGFNVRLSQEDSAELLKLSAPLHSSTDHCGNPLRQQKNITYVKNVEDYARGRDGTVKHFGVCTSENDQTIILARVSAAKHPTEYYVGHYLGGCHHKYSFVLSKAQKTTN